MREVYTDLNIRISIDNTTFLVLNIVKERFLRPLPKHSHGNRSFEIHYIPYGYGTVYIDNIAHEITPGTLYVTGPHVEHEQIPAKDNPMIEYCIYFKLQGDLNPMDSIAAKFEGIHSWFGADSENLLPLMEDMFTELTHRYSGYVIQVQSLLQQCVVKIVRNYEKHVSAKTHFLPSNLVDSKYLVVEESLLYEFETITLETLASKLGLSTRQTERFIKDYYGKTFKQKKIDAKMSMARSLLDDSALNISQIAERLNYSSIQHFSYAFKKYYGHSAREYRTTQKKSLR